jgi:hypothetical protein
MCILPPWYACLVKSIRPVSSTLLGFLFALLFLEPFDAQALEKYGRPLPSMKQAGESGLDTESPLFSGYFLTSVFPYNPSYFARPDNTGLVGMRHMLHLETDLYKQYLTFYTDQNFFSDRTNGWIELSEWDATYALTGVLDHFNWRIQYERDAGLDRRTIVQDYGDVLVTAKVQATQDLAWWRQRFPNQNLTAYAGGGWIFHNDNFFARPDNTGRALYRYVVHTDLDLYQNRVVLFGDINMFTDSQSSNKVRPSELDWMVGLALRWQNTEVAMYYEEDHPLDRSGLIQKYLAVQLRFSFDVFKRDVGIGKILSRTMVH